VGGINAFSEELLYLKRSLKFQTRLTLVFLTLFLAVQGIVVAAFYTTVNRNVDDQVRGQLSASAKTFTEIIQRRVDFLAQRVNTQALRSGFVAAVATKNIPEIQTYLRDSSKKIEADLAIVFSIEGGALAFSGNRDFDENSVSALTLTLREKIALSSVSATIIEINGHIYEMGIAPIYIGATPVFFVAYSRELDQLAALAIKQLSPINLEMAFLYKKEHKFDVASATSAQSALGEFLKDRPAGALPIVSKSSYLGEDYMFWRMDLEGVAAADAGIEVLLYYSVGSALQPYMSLAVTLSSVLLVGLIMLIGGSVALSRSVTRPLRRLASATNRIADGEYQEVEVLKNGDEIAKLTDSFNRMVAAVRDREDKIVFQACHDAETGLPNLNLFEKN